MYMYKDKLSNFELYLTSQYKMYQMPSTEASTIKPGFWYRAKRSTLYSSLFFPAPPRSDAEMDHHH